MVFSKSTCTHCFSSVFFHDLAWFFMFFQGFPLFSRVFPGFPWFLKASRDPLLFGWPQKNSPNCSWFRGDSVNHQLLLAVDTWVVAELYNGIPNWKENFVTNISFPAPKARIFGDFFFGSSSWGQKKCYSSIVMGQYRWFSVNLGYEDPSYSQLFPAIPSYFQLCSSGPKCLIAKSDLILTTWKRWPFLTRSNVARRNCWVDFCIQMGLSENVGLIFPMK